MTIPLPAALTRATVVWRMGHADTTGPLVGARGVVRFDATAVAVAYSDRTVLPEPVETPFIGGSMAPVDLIVNDPEVWNWKVTVRVGVPWEPFHIDVPTEGVNLAAAAVVPGRGPIRAVIGDPGPRGERGERGPEGPYGGTEVTDPQVASWLQDGTTEAHEALNNAVGRRTPGVVDALHPPPGLAPLVADADVYDPGAFKYFTGPGFDTPATDNTPALQAMVDHLYSAGGGVIVLPRGNFAFRGQIIWRSRVSLRGASKTSTRLYAEGDLFSLIVHATGLASNGSSADDPDLEWYEDCSFTDFLIDNRGLSYPDASVGGKAIFLLYMKRAVFRDLVLLNTIGTALGCDFLIDTVIDAVTVRNAGRNAPESGFGGNSGIGIGTAAEAKEPLVVSNCFTYDCGNYGIFVETQKEDRHRSLHAKIVNCHAEGNRLGFGNKGSGGTLFLGCSAVENRQAGFHFTQGSSGDRIIGCTANNNGDSGISVYAPYVGDLLISSTTARGNARFGIELNRGGSSQSIRNVTITGCEIAQNNGSGIYLHPAGGRQVTIASNLVHENGRNPTGLSKGDRGIYLSPGSDAVTITGNTFTDGQAPQTQRVGLEVVSVTHAVITGNNAPGYADDLAFLFPKSATFQGNSVPAEKSGTVTLPAGTAAVWVEHFLGTLPAKITLTPLGDARVWVSANEGNRMRVQRDNTTAALDVMWAVS